MSTGKKNIITNKMQKYNKIYKIRGEMNKVKNNLTNL